MTMEKIHTDKAPAAIGPYSQAIVHAGVLYTSGQIAINPETSEVEAKDICLLYTSPSPRDRG